jgi:hypothetical protein
LDSEEFSFETIEYPKENDRALYEGSTKNGVPWGTGILTMKNGETYIGCFENDLYNRFGKLRYSKNDIHDRKIYIGEFKNGPRHGKGRLEWTNGDIYEGEYQDNIKHGFAKEWYNNGNRFEGFFKDGQRSGNGTFTWLDGDKYIGAFTDGQLTGNGTYLFNPKKSVLRYEGEFKDWKHQNYGIMDWRNGERYEGNWENDLRHGFGTQFSANRSIIYSGEWKNGTRVN